MTANPMLPIPAPAQFGNTALRMMPVTTRALAPTAHPGDVWLLLPVGRYDGEGYYALDIEGAPAVYVVDTGTKRPGGIRINAGDGSAPHDMTVAEFEAMALAKVVGVVRVLDHRALDRRAAAASG